MIRRPLRFLLHFTTAVLLVAGVGVAIECVLLNRETVHRNRVDEPLSGTGVALRSPFTHHSLRPGAVVEHASDSPIPNRVVINNFGLRGADPVVPKPADTYRVVILGDETIFAPNMREADTAAFQLEKLLQQATRHQVEVINAAVPGYCPLLSLLQFRHNLVGLHPDLIVLHYDMSDVADDRRYRTTLTADKDGFSLSCSHPALLEGLPCDKSGTIGQFAIGRWVIGQLCEAKSHESSLNSRYAWLRSSPATEWDTPLTSSLEPIKELASMARQLSARFILTSTPISPDRIGGMVESDTVLSVWNRPHSVLTDFAKQQQIEFCDMTPAIAGATETEFLSETGLSRKGQYALAVELAAHVVGPQVPNYRQETAVQQVSGGG